MNIKSRELEPLSVRETEVLHWLCHGKSNWEIGQILELSQYTVKNHVSKILKKLGVSNRQHAAVKSVALGLVANGL